MKDDPDWKNKKGKKKGNDIEDDLAKLENEIKKEKVIDEII